MSVWKLSSMVIGYSLLGFLLLSGVSISLAQDTDDYEWEAVALEFEYPEDWELIELDDGSVSLISEQDVVINMYAPPVLLPRPTYPYQVLNYIMDTAPPSAVFDTPDPYELLDDTIAIRLDYTSDDYGGMLIVFVYDEAVILIDAFVVERVFNNSDADVALDVIDTLEPAN